ncbi:MAG TPA: hypothetical protein VFO34_01105, partial [Candidatus Acidoferrales bacterium]|nr:hypothetical protein [Candidatus Acidoferrales bacterium]
FVFRRFARPASEDDLERRRRLRVNQIGRICEGQITELIELPATPAPRGGFFGMFRGSNGALNPGRKLICYAYSISGVTYETSQDVTTLSDRVTMSRLVAGQHASVKYNPSNPSDSILVADDWSGLH